MSEKPPSFAAEFEEDIGKRTERAKEISQGNADAMAILENLIGKGPVVFDRIAPKLGTGQEVVDKIKEYDGDLDKAIADLDKEEA